MRTIAQRMEQLSDLKSVSMRIKAASSYVFSEDMRPFKGKMTSRSASGQISIKIPKNIDEAIALMDEMGALRDEAEALYKKDPSPKNAMREQHAREQMNRAMSYSKTFAKR